MLRLSRFTTFTKIVIPATLPYIFTGYRLSLGIAWLVIVASEMLTGTPGVGGFLWQEYNSLIYAHILLAILTIGLIGFGLDRLMGMAEASCERSERQGIECQWHSSKIQGASKTFTRSKDGSGTCSRASSLTVDRGEFVSIVGFMGCGKSTFLNIVAGLVAAGCGTVTIDGDVVRGVRQERRIRVSELLAAAVVLGARERAAGGRRRLSRRGRARGRSPSAAVSRQGRSGERRRSAAEPALGRHAAARRHRAGVFAPSPKSCSWTSRSARSMR